MYLPDMHELVLFGVCHDDEVQESIKERILSSMEARNNRKDIRFKLSASIGTSRHRATEINSLNEFIEAADKKMYEEKRQKHLEQRIKE